MVRSRPESTVLASAVLELMIETSLIVAIILLPRTRTWFVLTR
jgi:hypothetical protein